MVYHDTPINSRVYFKFNSSELLHTRASVDQNFTVKLQIEYKLFEDYATKRIKDAGVIIISEESDPSAFKSIIGYFNIADTLGKKYWLEILVKDVYRNTHQSSFIWVDKSNPNNEQNFEIFNKQLIQQTNYNAQVGEQLFFKFNNPNVKKYWIQFYHKDFSPAPPPFMYETNLEMKFEESYGYEIDIQDSIGHIFFDRPGLYIVKADSSSSEGLSFLCFDSFYPEIHQKSKLAGPLRYITTKKEYNEILEASDEAAFEQFWLNISGNNPDRSRELIREYYLRVKLANELFTSYMEGWKTDRGMIYTVFGPPNIVYKAVDGETWIYGEDSNMLSLNFFFSKVENFLSDNDFSLNRSNIYRTTYYKAVDTWRQGRILSQN